MESSTIQLVGVAVPTLRELRSAVLASPDAEFAVGALREAGYAGGDAVYAAFEQWLRETREGEAEPAAAELPIDEFGDQAAAFFRGAGWGEVTFSQSEGEDVAIVDISSCWEGGAGGDAGCQVTTGLLAAFFGRVAGYPVAVLETECCAGTLSRCRFLLGNPAVMQYRWDELQRNEA